MNIFPLEHRDNNESLQDWCARIAHSHCDQHQKLILEAWQQLNTGCNVLGIETDNKSIAYKNHPCTVWTRATLGNWQFVIEYAYALALDMAERYGKNELHKSAIRIEESIPYCGDGKVTGDITEFAKAMPDALKRRHTCSVDAYREYYSLYKSWFARKQRGTDKYIVYPCTWKHGNIPEWFVRNPLRRAVIGGCVDAWQGSKRIVLTKEMIANYDEMCEYRD